MEKYIELIKILYKIIYGDEKTFGMDDNLDHYYRGCWDKEKIKADKLIKELKIDVFESGVPKKERKA